jgi:hypothetical protein
VAVFHIVLLALKEGMSGGERAHIHASFKDAVSRIPGVEAVEIGQNFARSQEQYSDAFIITLKDRKALEAYATHEKHIEAGKMLAPYITNVMSADFES